MKTLLLTAALVLLAVGSVAAQAKERECVRLIRLCATKSQVTNPNEYGWMATNYVAKPNECVPERKKGFGWKQKETAALCDCLPFCEHE